MTALIGLLGILFAGGLVLLIAALTGVDLELSRVERPKVSDKSNQLALRLGCAVVLGSIIALVTGWPVGALLAGIAGYVLPGMIGGGAARQAEITRIEGIAAWAEMLRDTMAGAGGLEQSIMATAPLSPKPIRTEVMRLAGRLERDRLAPALRAFAEDLDDPTGDLVVAALLLAADKSPKRLGDLLGTLALSARAEVNMRLRVDAGRARTRTSVRVVTVSTMVFSTGLVLLNRGYLDPYDSAFGQLVLALVGGFFGAAFVWLARSSQFEVKERFLRSADASSGGAPA